MLGLKECANTLVGGSLLKVHPSCYRCCSAGRVLDILECCFIVGNLRRRETEAKSRSSDDQWLVAFFLNIMIADHAMHVDDLNVTLFCYQDPSILIADEPTSG